MAKAIPGAAREPQPQPKAGIKVRATRVGYYGDKRRREGDVFLIDPEVYPKDVLNDPKDEKSGVRFAKGALVYFSPTWMEFVEPEAPLKETGAAEALKAEQDKLRSAKSTGDQSVI